MLRNIGSNWILNVLRIAVLMHLTPYVIGALGPDVNGVWVSIVSLTGFLKLLILGVPMASVRFLAEHLANDDHEEANRAISTCLGICVFLGACAALIGGALYVPFDRLLLENPRWQELGPAVAQSARLAYLLVVAQVGVGFALRLPYGIFDAHQDFVVRNWVMAGELLLRYGLTIALLAANASVVVLAAVQIVCMLAEFAALMLLIRSRYPALRFGLGSFDRGAVRAILGFSVFTLLLNAGAMLAFRSDALVIGSFLGATEVTNFDVANKFFEPLTELVLGIAVVVMPMATRMRTQGQLEQLTVILMRWSKIAFSIVLVVGVYLATVGPEFLAWWLGADYDPSSGPVLQVLTVSFLVYLPVRGVALPILMGLGKPGRPALGLLVMGLVNLGISVALVRRMGILGVALGTAIPNVVFAVFVAWLACREIGAEPWAYARHVFGRCALGALVPAGILLVLKHVVGVRGFLPLLGAGLLSTAAFGAVWVLFVYRHDPHLDLLARLRARRAGAAP